MNEIVSAAAPKGSHGRRMAAGLTGVVLVGAMTVAAPLMASAAEPAAHYPLDSSSLRSDALHPAESIGGDAGTYLATHVELGARPHNDHVAGSTPAAAKVTGDELSLSLDFRLPSAQPRATTADSVLLTYGGRTDYAQNSISVHPYNAANTAAVVIYQSGSTAKTVAFPAPASDAWHNVVVSLDGGSGGQLTVYLDGSRVGQTSADGIGADEVGNQVIRIGRDKSPINIAGSYRDLYVFPEAVDASEAASLAAENAEFAWDSLESGLAFGDGDTISRDLRLPAGNGMTWSVPTGQTALAENGTIDRPAIGQPDAPVQISLDYRGELRTYDLSVAALTDGSDPSASLLASYDFSESSGTVLHDATAAGRDATVVGGDAWQGGFMQFTGSNHVQLPNDLLAGRSAATIVIETTPEALSGAKFLWNIGGSGNAATGQFFIQPVTPRLTITKTNYTAEQTVNTSTRLVEGRSQSVAATIEKNADGITSTMRLFVDGTLIGEKTDSTVNLSDLTTHTMNYIGRSAYSGDSLYQGRVSAFHVYESALTTQELAGIAAADAKAAAAESIAAIDLDAANEQDLAQVETALTLPTTGSVTWTSSPAGIVAADGNVTQPASDTEVTLTATAAVRGESESREFTVTVLKAPTAAEQAQRDVAAVSIADMDDVRSNVTLPASGSRYGSSLSWTSSAPGTVDVAGTDDVAGGIVHRPADADAAVTLTVTATKDGQTASREIALTVRRAYEMPKTTDYLFAHFTGTEGSPSDEQIYLATSRDALTFTDTRANGDPVLSLTKDQGDGGVRDPFVIRSPEGDRFYLIATDLSIHYRGGWGAAQATETGSMDLVVWESTDLVNWSEPRFVDVASRIPNAGMAWAPEAIWDEETGQYYVYWATRADGNTEFGDSVDVYMSTTRDFQTFSTPVKWIDREHSIIDTSVIKVGDWFYRASGDGEITIERSKNLAATTASATANAAGTDQDWVLVGTLQSILSGSGNCSGGANYTGGCLEGPEFFEYNDDDRADAEHLYGLLADQYATGRGYLPFRTTDIGSTSTADWSKATDVNLGSLKKRHGGILPITAQEYQRVMFRYAGIGADPDLSIETAVTSRCAAGKAVLVVSTTNADTRAADVTVTTSYGMKTFTGVQPGKTVSQAFSTRQVALAAGVVDVTADADDASYQATEGYGARTCG